VGSAREEAIGGYSKPEDGRLFNYRLHPDLFLVEPVRRRGTSGERVAGILISQVRALVPEMSGPPFEAPRRIGVIDDAHAMNEQTQNALLKCLEEPAPTSHLFLVTSHPEALLPTIRSRCQVLRFGPLPPESLARHLEERGEADAHEAALRAQLAEGSVARALELDLDGYRSLRSELLEKLASLSRGGARSRLELADWLREQASSEDVLSTLRGVLRDLGVLAAGETARLINEDARASLEHLADTPLGARGAALASAVGETRQALQGYLDVSGRPHGPAQTQMAYDGLADRLGDALV
jgi:DNA polymerase-3 subunit delta'